MSEISKKALALGCASLMAVSMVACGGSETAQPPGSQPAATQASAPAEQAGLSVGEGDFGVPECDNYMKKYLECVDSKVPEAGREALKQALEQSRTAWQQAAATPEGKAGLAAACTQAEAAAKQAMMAYGCAW